MVNGEQLFLEELDRLEKDYPNLFKNDKLRSHVKITSDSITGTTGISVDRHLPQEIQDRITEFYARYLPERKL